MQTALLLALLGFQTTGWLALWQLAYREARQHAKEAMRLQCDHLVERTLSAATYRKCRVDKREVRLDGKMFDIASEKLCGDSVRLLLYRDIREEQLYSKMSQILAPAFDASPQPVSGPPTLYSLLSMWLHAGALPPRPPCLTGFFGAEIRLSLPPIGIPCSQVVLPQHGPPPKG